MKKAVLTFICTVILLGAIGAAALDMPYKQPESSPAWSVQSWEEITLGAAQDELSIIDGD